MLRFNLLFRSVCVSPKFPPKAHSKYFSSQKNSGSSESSSSSDDEHLKKNVKEGDADQKTSDNLKSQLARDKLNSLLTAMIKEDVPAAKKLPTLDLAKPRNQRRKDVRTEPGAESVKSKPVEQQVVKAVKDVAETIGGDVKQTELELLQKLLNPIKDDSGQTTTTSLSDLFKDMKIDRESSGTEQISRAQQVRQMLEMIKAKQLQTRQSRAIPRMPRQRTVDPDIEDNIIEERVKLFEGDRLGIFPPVEEMATWDNPQLNNTWNSLYERELRLAVTHPPSNYFQQMILWTEQGKLWRFPIDNEQELEKEKSVSFTDHIFLEKYLEPWCPAKGPIRHFMELVCVGLSKNPYLTVEKKKEHIEWFIGYFDEKKQILRDTAAIPPDFEFIQNSPKSISPNCEKS